MPESSLSLSWSDLKSQVGLYLGHGADAASWGSSEIARIEDIVHSGIRRVYTPTVFDYQNRPVVYEWSWLRPVTTLSTVANQQEYNLPDSFASIMEEFTYGPGQGYVPIQVVSESKIRNYDQNNLGSGRPMYASIEPIAGKGPTRYKVRFWPTPDATYTLSYQYKATVEKLSDDNPYPLGGMPMAELYLESCLAVAEHRADDMETSHHQAQFRDLLMAAVDHDRKATSAKYFGYNGNDMQRDWDAVDCTTLRSIRNLVYTPG